MRARQPPTPPLDLRGVVDATVDPRVPAGAALRDFTDAVVDRDRDAWVRAVAELADRLGPAAPAAGVTANFQMMNRLLDATGVPVPQRRVDLGRALGMVPR